MGIASGSRRWAEYALSIAIIALAALWRWSVPEIFAQTPFLVFYPALVVAAMLGGMGPGLLATLLAVLCYAFWFAPAAGGLQFHSAPDWLRMAFFVGGGSGVSFLAHLQRSAQRREHQRAEALRRSQDETRRQKDLLAVTLASIGDAVIVTDDQGRVSFLNGEARRLTGWLETEAHGRPLPEVFQIINEHTRQTVANPAEKVLQQGQVVGLANHTVLITKDGREIPIDDSGAPVRLADGTIHGVVLIFRDITQRRAAEQAMLAAKVSADQAKAAAEEANLAKDHFVAVLSHELRTPLTPVLTIASVLEVDPQLPERYREDLGVLRRNVELEARLIDDLLDVTRIVRGKLEIHKRPVNLCEVIQRAVDVCRLDIEARGLEFGVDLGAEAPYLIEADAARLQQVFWNLFKNAIKFTPHGGCVGVRCRLHGDHVIAEVNDSGVGIEPAVLPRLFQPFEQGGPHTARQFGGLGLGLTIAKGMVELHGGSIDVHSEGTNKGASFRVKLPLISQESLPKPTGTAPSAAELSHGGLSILLVEDHGDTARVMKRLLTASGHVVQSAGDVATALELARQHRIDLLISDLGLPDGSGIDLMRQLHARGQQIPSIALSGYGQEQDIRRSKAAGFAEHLTKPTSPERLAEAIAAVTNRMPAAPAE